jgi:hypothetical protein
VLVEALMKSCTYDQSQIAVMKLALDEAYRTVEFTGALRKGSMIRELLASAILKAASDGEGSPIALCNQALRRLPRLKPFYELRV